MRTMAIGVISIYQRVLSPYWPSACRYTPTCSHYAQEAIETHGVLKGGWLALRRLSRCGPWGSNGYDPVPEPRHAHHDEKHAGAGSAWSSRR